MDSSVSDLCSKKRLFQENRQKEVGRQLRVGFERKLAFTHSSTRYRVVVCTVYGSINGLYF